MAPRSNSEAPAAQAEIIEVIQNCQRQLSESPQYADSELACFFWRVRFADFRSFAAADSGALALRFAFNRLAVHEVDRCGLAEEVENNKPTKDFAEMTTHQAISKGLIDAQEAIGV